MIFILAVLLMVCSFKIVGFLLRAGLGLFGLGIAIVAFLLLSPLLGLLTLFMPLIFLGGIVFIIAVIVKAVRR